MVKPKSGEPFTLGWPAENSKEHKVSALAVAVVLAAVLGFLYFCEDCARFLAQIARVLR